MSWVTDFGPIFWTSIFTMCLGCLHLSVKYIYKTKVKKCSCCGIVIERDIESETKIDSNLLSNSNKTRRASDLSLPNFSRNNTI
jgi:hypothetical protein